MKQIALNDATATQLVEFANPQLGMELVRNIGKAKIIAAMKTAGYQNDFIEIEDEAPAVQVPSEGGKRGTAERGPEYDEQVCILIEKQEEEDGGQPVPVSVNGRLMLIERGVESVIPRPYYEALKNATKTVYTSDPNVGLTNKRDIPIYPFHVVRHLV